MNTIEKIIELSDCKDCVLDVTGDCTNNCAHFAVRHAVEEMAAFKDNETQKALSVVYTAWQTGMTYDDFKNLIVKGQNNGSRDCAQGNF